MSIRKKQDSSYSLPSQTTLNEVSLQVLPEEVKISSDDSQLFTDRTVVVSCVNVCVCMRACTRAHMPLHVCVISSK